MLLGLRNTSPPLVLSILLTATRRHLDTCHFPSTESSQEAEGAGAGLEDFLEEEVGETISSIPAGAAFPTLKSPRQLFKGKNPRRGREERGGWSSKEPGSPGVSWYSGGKGVLALAGSRPIW